MTLGWTDDNTFLLINNCLLASSKENHLIGHIGDFNGSFPAAECRELARMKETDAMIELLKSSRRWISVELQFA